jgi:hypothetical protein
VANYGCSKDDDNGGGGGPVDVLSGVILAPDSVTPIAGATVYVPVNPTDMKTTFNIDTGDCTEPDEAYIVYTCTDVDGSFELVITGVTATNFTLRVTKGSFQVDYTVNLNTTSGNLGNLPLPSNPEQGAGKFAVVTGYYDRMQDILAKLGMGELDEFHMLVLGTETFDLYDGDYSLDEPYPDFPELFETDGETGNPVIYNYDMVFINCGSGYEYDILYDETKLGIIRDYVSGGGKLYITDLSYDYVEQVFPEYIDFYGSDETDETEKEEIGAAEVGESGITSEATVNDSQLKAWLQTVLCQDGSCLNPDMTVHIAGFWAGWAVINGAHSLQSSSVKIWITGPVSWYDWALVDPEGSGDKPLTLSFVHGLGRVLYTSYHTEEDNPSSGFWPQERILQYLVLEL